MNLCKIVFFVKPGLDNFIDPVIAQLAGKYETKKVIVQQMEQIDEGMEWADICWFEWCDDLLIYGSKLPLARVKPVICRLHSYEAFTYYIYRVEWDAVDQLIFVGKHIQEFVQRQVPATRGKRTIVIPNGVDLDRYSFTERERGFHIAYVGYINYKKGPMLMLHAFKAIHDRDPRYKLFLAGVYQDARYSLYFEQMIKEMNLTGSIHFEGWQNDINQYLEDKHYILVTSVLESQHMSVMEGMAKGLKPLVHNFYGAKKVFDEAFVWNTIGELVEMVVDGDYSPTRYRSYIEQHYGLEKQMRSIEETIESFAQVIRKRTLTGNTPKVTVGIVNYNYGRFLQQCLDSVLAQAYPNIEIIIVDDQSTDDSIEIIRRYEEQHANIKFILHLENTGLPDQAFHEIYREASGEYVLPMSADDYLPHSHVIDRYVQCFTEANEELDYVYGDFTLVDVNGKPIDTWNYHAYTDREIIYNLFHRYGSGVIPMNCMYRTSYFQTDGHSYVVDPVVSAAGDTLNCLINTKRGWKRRHLNEPLLCNRRHGNNASLNMEKRIASLIGVLDYIVDHFAEDIYLPSIPWDQLESGQRNALKYFKIGQHYANMSIYYQDAPFSQNLDPAQKKQCVQPLLARMKHYMELSLQSSNAFRPDIEAVIASVSPLAE